MRLVVDDTFNRIQKLILSRTVALPFTFALPPPVFGPVPFAVLFLFAIAC